MAYQISRSLRFNSADSARLTRTFAAAPTDRTRCRMAFNAKRGKLGTAQQIFVGYDVNGVDSSGIGFNSSDQLVVKLGQTGGGSATTNMVFRDPTAHYHFDVIVDTSQVAAADRITIKVNGAVATWTGTPGSVNHQWAFNNGNNRIGCEWNDTNFFDGLLSDFFFIADSTGSGASFGQISSVHGGFELITPTGVTFATNGFHLDFSDNTGATSSTLGKDRSGNNNDWTPTNLSVTAGVGNDSLTDTPTNYGTDTGAGGEVRGDFATWNPLHKSATGSQPTFSDGNLKFTGVSQGAALTTQKLFGKIYAEMTLTLATYCEYGIGGVSTKGNAADPSADQWGFYYNGTPYSIEQNTNLTNISGSWGSSGAAFQTGDIGLIAVDVPNNKIWIGRNRSGTVTWLGGGDPAAGTSPTYSGSGGGGVYSTAVDLSTLDWFIYVGAFTTSVWELNCGQRPFSATAPSGFKALCTQNIPDTTIKRGDDYFTAHLRTGTGGVTSVSGKRFSPNFVWSKSRSALGHHVLHDTVRGPNRQWFSSLNQAEGTETDQLTAFNADGYSLGANAGGTGSINVNGVTYVDWLFKTGAISGLSIVAYTGNGVARTLAHGLTTAPKLVIIKPLGSPTGGQTYVWMTGLSGIQYMVLHTTGAALTTDGTLWNSAVPDATNIHIGTYTGVNQSSINYVAYVFSEVPGFSKIGSYAGNGSADGPFVYCEFEPELILIKNQGAVGNWNIADARRNSFNPANLCLLPNSNTTESTNTTCDFLASGFKVRGTSGDNNDAANTYNFLALGKRPFKYSATTAFAEAGAGFDMSSMGMFCLP